MSLVVWLPMTKDLRQQGLSNRNITNTGATFSSNGKLGGCYLFDGTDDAIGIGDLNNICPDGNFSFACWFYKSEFSSKGYDTIFGGPSGFELETKNGTTNSNVIVPWNWGKPQIAYEFDKWYHLVMTRTSSGTTYYLNGEQVATGTAGTIPAGNYFIGAWNTATQQNYKGKLNDVRIYDHCLSPMEVKRISQGLVLHYPLNRMGFGQENLFKNSSLTDLTSSNLSTKIYYQGSYIPEITQNGLKFTWTGSSAREIDLWLDKTLKADTYYTLSFIYRNNMAIGSSFYLRKDGNLVGYWSQPTIPYSEDWSIYRCTFKIANYQSNDATTGTLLTLFYSGYTANKWIELKQNSIKLEEGSIATPWSPAPSDDLATQMGLNSNIEYDTSGYCNNGTRTGTFDWTSNTPKYGVSTQFNGTQYIQIPFPCSTISEAVSVAVWGYESNWNTSSAERLIGAATNSSGWCIGDYGSENTLFAFYANGGYNVATGFKQLSSGWHHFVITFDGLNLIYYVDGQQFSKKTFSTKQVATGNYNINIGRHYGGGYNFKGNMSDVRIYATALSADDVKSLYQNTATIDADGTIHGAVR